MNNQLPEIIRKFWHPTVSLRHVQSVVRPAVETCPAVLAVRRETGCTAESENAEWQIDCPRFYELLQYRKEDIAEWAAAEKKMSEKIAVAYNTLANVRAAYAKVRREYDNIAVDRLRAALARARAALKEAEEEIKERRQAQWRAEAARDACEEKLKKNNELDNKFGERIAELESQLAEKQKAWNFATLAVAEGTKHMATLDGLVHLKVLKDEERASRGGGGSGGISIPDRPTPTPG